MVYPSVKKLKTLIKEHNIHIQKVEDVTKELFFVVFTFGNNRKKVLIEDEFGDFDETNQPLALFLVLRALEDYHEAEDILAWSRVYGVKVGDFLSYYKELDGTYSKVKECFGEVDSYIPSFDFQLRNGEYEVLLKLKPS